MYNHTLYTLTLTYDAIWCYLYMMRVAIMQAISDDLHEMKAHLHTLYANSM